MDKRTIVEIIKMLDAEIEGLIRAQTINQTQVSFARTAQMQEVRNTLLELLADDDDNKFALAACDH